MQGELVYQLTYHRPQCLIQNETPSRACAVIYLPLASPPLLLNPAPSLVLGFSHFPAVSHGLLSLSAGPGEGWAGKAELGGPKAIRGFGSLSSPEA